MFGIMEVVLRSEMLTLTQVFQYYGDLRYVDYP